LQEQGAQIMIGHAAENLPAEASLVVYSSAVPSENPEFQEARLRGIPIVRRAEVLAELMRLKYGVAVAGSHGKTSTTSMVGAILEEAGLDPTVVIGGIVKSIGTGGKLGKSNYLVAESDESDRSFLILKPTVAVVTNIDKEHLQAYKSLEDLEHSFEKFINAVPFYGLAVLCADDPKVSDLAARYTKRMMTYGMSPQADIRADNVVQQRSTTSFDVLVRNEFRFRIDLPLPGRHLMVNSLAAIAVAMEFGVSDAQIVSGLNSFAGVGRRLETIGVVQGVTVVDDYGHHPTEIKASIQALRDGFGSELNRLHVVFQPHRYSRTQDSFVDFIQSFRECDRLITTEIYSAGESPIEGISGQVLSDAINHPEKEFCSTLDECRTAITQGLSQGDVVLCCGAGSIGGFAQTIVADLEKSLTSERAA
ncbi:MAG: UDP-N-acetylmuramate--L-alanine ligase, partial [Bdellovibrionales bacterium]|nr:UDP-N-acetylmuramate--L-alanine ligase [Bdellovibrionales bacterium]